MAATPVVIALMLAGSRLRTRGVRRVRRWQPSPTISTGWSRGGGGEVSALGVFMDLTADKVLVGGVLIAMVEVGLLPTWMVATIVVRELVIAGGPPGRRRRERRHRRAAARQGKDRERR